MFYYVMKNIIEIYTEKDESKVYLNSVQNPSWNRALCFFASRQFIIECNFWNLASVSNRNSVMMCGPWLWAIGIVTYVVSLIPMCLSWTTASELNGQSKKSDKREQKLTVALNLTIVLSCYNCNHCTASTDFYRN